MPNPPITSIGEALFGARWQTDLARARGVSDRTVRRWASGETAPGEADIAALLAIAEGRVAEVAGAAEALRRMVIPAGPS